MENYANKVTGTDSYKYYTILPTQFKKSVKYEALIKIAANLKTLNSLLALIRHLTNF